MLDIKFIRANPDKVKEAIKLKNIELDLDHLLELDSQVRQLKQKLDDLRAQKNKASDEIKRGGDKQAIVADMKKVDQESDAVLRSLKEVEPQLNSLMYKTPTIPSPDTPRGKDESDNKVISVWGEPTKFDFQPKDHMQLGKDLDIIDFKQGVKVSGYRGYYLKNQAVMLQMGFLMYALQKAIKRGFSPMLPPTLVREFALKGSGYFKDESYNPEVDEIYKIANDEKLADGSTKKEDKFLVGTAEPSILAYYADQILDKKTLPLKICGFSQCYRSEIGSYGRDTKGIYRVHEFMKMELVAIAEANVEQSEKLHQELIGISKELHEDLGLPYRQIQMCTGDLTVGKYKQYDLEAWIPSRDGYGETGSASNFLDWQARRLKVRYKDDDGKTKNVYMLNDTALPSPRILIAILENYQQADGSVKIPQVLVPYVGFEEISSKK